MQTGENSIIEFIYFVKVARVAYIRDDRISGFLLSDAILFLKNDIRIRSESCFG